MVARDEASARFCEWLRERVDQDATGAAFTELKVAPGGKFWLGTLTPEDVARESTLGERVDRVAPCAVGFLVRADDLIGRAATITIRGTTWQRHRGRKAPTEDADPSEVEAGTSDEGGDEPTSGVVWRKRPEFELSADVVLTEGSRRVAEDELKAALSRCGAAAMSAALEIETTNRPTGTELAITLVNTSPKPGSGEDNDFYEVELEIGFPSAPLPFLLESLPSSFRYDRRVPIYGINCGVGRTSSTNFRTRDGVSIQSSRPVYWDEEHAGPQPDFRFETLGNDPRTSCRDLVSAMRKWGDRMWADSELASRADAEGWSDDLVAAAREAAGQYREEIDRVEAGVQLLETNGDVRHAFALANRAFQLATAGKYDSWRPFQLGFQLVTLPSLLDGAADRDVVDTLWFATGGGKTETYLGIVVTAAFLDRLRGKQSGVTAWARFPLRMLSLQQTQRFADILAAAEVVRRQEGLEGDPFALGFYVGATSTPNRFEADPSVGDANFRDAATHRTYQVLIACPFCHSENLTVTFDESRWMLDHVCRNPDCSWEGPLPFRIVDDEIFRTLPTVVVGTIDKTAGLGFQASIVGLYGAPYGRCPEPHHGFTYAPRSKRPQGCLVPECGARSGELGQEAGLFAPTLRIQDELHLLRDSLGAMSAHYEAALDHLQALHGERAKILASSATLAGHDEQVDVLYRRAGRVFPRPGPRFDHSFWSRSTEAPGRLYVGLAPRGVTLDFAADRLVEAIQRAVREVESDPTAAASELDLEIDQIDQLVSDYGTSVSYGSTLKDVEAAARSFETQIPIDGQLNAVTLTGRVPFETVREALHRLENPEPDFEDRIHLIAASSMISHGVDVNRLNIMTMMGLPLTTAEFIQATARVGRTRPGIVFVLHKMLRERDAGVFRSFDLFVTHGDRLVEPVPVTKRSRAVLQRTFPGLFLARHLGVHERSSIRDGGPALTTVARWRQAALAMPITARAELEALVDMLAATGPLDSKLVEDLESLVERVLQHVQDPATEERFPSEVLLRVTGNEPMTSLRDVDAAVAVYSAGGHRA